jgi:hypothetical protein
MHCGYCDQEAVLRIPSIPEQVCHEHAVEYWTALVKCASDHPASEPERVPSDCWICNGLSASAAARNAALLVDDDGQERGIDGQLRALVGDESELPELVEKEVHA